SPVGNALVTASVTSNTIGTASQYSLQGLWGASHTVFHDIGHIRKNKQTEQRRNRQPENIFHVEVLPVQGATVIARLKRSLRRGNLLKIRKDF
ncbi:MAG: hypothetical protein J6V99_00240, partial [Neisseriaceae bacterium]|nr:hypothetical protein [Neisseriaceae bacterium]